MMEVKHGQKQKIINYPFVFILSFLEILYKALFSFSFVLEWLLLDQLLVLDLLEVTLGVTSLTVVGLVHLVPLGLHLLSLDLAPGGAEVPLVDAPGVGDGAMSPAGGHRDGHRSHLAAPGRAPHHLLQARLVPEDAGNVL